MFQSPAKSSSSGSESFGLKVSNDSQILESFAVKSSSFMGLWREIPDCSSFSHFKYTLRLGSCESRMCPMHLRSPEENPVMMIDFPESQTSRIRAIAAEALDK